MKWIGREEIPEMTSLRSSLKTVLDGLGFKLIELAVSKHRGSVQIRVVIYNGAAAIGTDDCAKVHRAIMPRLELAFNGQEPQPGARTAGSSPDIYLEVSSPGTERLIKDGMEFANYKGREVRCYRIDISDWTAGFLESADESGIILKTKDGRVNLTFDVIAKAKLGSLKAAPAASKAPSQEV